MGLFKVVKSDIEKLENLDLYITIALSIIVAILNIFGIIRQSILFSTILATLSIVAVGLLVNRHQNQLLQQTLAEAKVAEDFLQEEQYDPALLKDRVLQAEKILLVGLSLSRTVTILENTLEKAIMRRAKIQILLIKPNSEASRMATLRDKNLAPPSLLDERINHTLARLASIAHASGEPDKIEVRFLDYLPAWGLIAIDPHLKAGYISVRLNAFRIPTETCPRFELNASTDIKWFGFFANQLELLWEEAIPTNLLQHSEKF